MELKTKIDLTLLKKTAIKEASNQNWERAKQVNLAILNQLKNNIETLNRLGIAYTKLDQKQNAIKCFDKVINISPNNIIAQKNLTALKSSNNKKITNTIDKKLLVNDSSKSINIKFELKSSIKSLNPGDDLIIKTSNETISIFKNKILLNELNNNLAKRIAKLMKLGNKYSCTVIGTNEKKINVSIKETHKSDKNIQIISFPEYMKPNSENISLNQNSLYLSQSEPEEPTEK
tara:strand:+ start:201 stop:896 length:696 start_codon:yes stop_codon:yes gene_type:complete